MAAVATGQLQQWQIQAAFQDWQFPNMTYPLPGWANEPWQMVTGMAWDSVAQNLYVQVRFASNGGCGDYPNPSCSGVSPVVYVYHVADSTPLPRVPYGGTIQ
jgi:hypothetical protein